MCVFVNLRKWMSRIIGFDGLVKRNIVWYYIDFEEVCILKLGSVLGIYKDR